MAWYDVFTGRLPEVPPERNRSVMTAEELVRDYQIVDVTEDAIVVTRNDTKKLADVSSPTLQELGYAAPSPFTSWTRREYNIELAGRQGLMKYDQMRRSDATVRGSLRLLKTPVLNARWFIEAASDSVADQNIADFVWWAMTERMTYGFESVLEEALLMLDFGWYAFEKVFEKDVWKNRPVVCWAKLAPRHPLDILEWKYDITGGPNEIVMYPNPQSDNSQLDDVTIPIDKLIVFTYQKEAGNMEGISVLRSAYKHWYYKEQLYKIDAIQKERHSIGVPIIILPPGYSQEDKDLAQELGRNLRTNDRAHVVLPPLWEFHFAEMKMGGLADPLLSVSHHDLQIQKNILAPFMGGATDSPAVMLKEEEAGFFLKNARDVANIITRTFNEYAIRQLVDLNYQRLPNGYPKLRARRIGEDEDWRTLSFTIRNMIGAGAIVPDDKLEDFLREYLDLPRRDPDTARIIVGTQLLEGPEGEPLSLPPGQQPQQPTSAPQLPGVGANQAKAPGLPRVGPPRQKPATSGTALPPHPTGGNDRSGGQ